MAVIQCVFCKNVVLIKQKQKGVSVGTDCCSIVRLFFTRKDMKYLGGTLLIFHSFLLLCDFVVTSTS